MYNNNREFEQGALCIRVAQSFTRFGNFEMMAAQNSELTKDLMNYEIKRNFKNITDQILDKINFSINNYSERILSTSFCWCLLCGRRHG